MSGCRSRPHLTLGLVALFVLLIGCGLAIGDVFETYENGSNL